MGKSMIIKGANFAPMRIESGFQKIDYIGLSDKNGEETGIGRYIYSGVDNSSNTRMSVKFETAERGEDDIYNNIVIAGTQYDISSVMRICLNSNNVTISFGSYDGMLLQENKKIIYENIWDGNEHTIDFCIDFIKIDNSSYNNWNNNNNLNIGDWGGPIYLDCASCLPEDGYNTYISFDKAQKSLSYRDSKGFDASCVKLREIKIWENYSLESSLVVDAIPVIRKKDNIVCFYNKVNGEYLVRNDGSIPSHALLDESE